MEEELHLKRSDLLKIIDVNVDFLRNMDYTKIMEEKEDSLEKLLYIFVCDEESILDKVYVENKLMEGVRKKMARVARDIDEYLYYNKEEFDKHCMESLEEEAIERGYKSGHEAGLEAGLEAGHKAGFVDGQAEEKLKIARNLLSKNMNIDFIESVTGLTKEEIDNLKS